MAKQKPSKDVKVATSKPKAKAPAPSNNIQAKVQAAMTAPQVSKNNKNKKKADAIAAAAATAAKTKPMFSFSADSDEEAEVDLDTKLNAMLDDEAKKRDAEFEKYMNGDMAQDDENEAEEEDAEEDAEMPGNEDEDEEDAEMADEDAAEEDEDEEDEEEAPIPEVDANEFANPFLECYKRWMKQAPKDMDRVFSPELKDERRAELMDMLPTKAQRKYAWAIPDERAIRVLYNYGPIVEIGAGKGYWGYLLRKFVTSVNAAVKKGETLPFPHRPELLSKGVYVGYDFKPYAMAGETAEQLEEDYEKLQSSSILAASNRPTKGKKGSKGMEQAMKKVKNFRQDEFPAWEKIQKGGPEKLLKHSDRTLFLCYPDDFEYNAKSMAFDCLKRYKGDTIIVVGEALGQTYMDNPWGRSADADFQLHLAADFHKVLQLPLPSWPGSMDTLCVWKRTQKCAVADMQIKHIPANEMISLLQTTSSTASLATTKSAVFGENDGPKVKKEEKKNKKVDEHAEAEKTDKVEKKSEEAAPKQETSSKKKKLEETETPVEDIVENKAKKQKKLSPADMLVAKMEAKEKKKASKADEGEYNYDEAENAKPKIPLAKKLIKNLVKRKD